MGDAGDVPSVPQALSGPSAAFRLGIAGAIGVAVALGVLLGGAPKYAPAVGWDVACAAWLIWTWIVLRPMGADRTAAYATREDPTRAATDLVLVAAAVASLAAVGFFLLQVSSASGATKDVLAGVGVATVALSWLLVHTVYTLNYARLYYLRPAGGIDFNQSTPPSYADFAYFAFTLGMTFQVSDTAISRPAIRSTVLRHALLSYLFGAVILGTTINLIAGLASSG